MLSQQRICCLGIEHKDEICLINKNINGKGSLISIEDTKENHEIVIENKSKTKEIKLKSFHMSCKSDPIDVNKNYLGIILYQYKNQTDWVTEKKNIHCKTGYMCIKIDSSFIDKKWRKSLHAQLYHWLFDEWPDKDVIGAGFSIQKGKIVFCSRTFNLDNTHKNNSNNSGDKPGVMCEFHDSDKNCHPIEQKWIKIALRNWINGEQNTLIQEPNSNICWNFKVTFVTINDIK